MLAPLILCLLAAAANSFDNELETGQLSLAPKSVVRRSSPGGTRGPSGITFIGGLRPRKEPKINYEETRRHCSLSGEGECRCEFSAPSGNFTGYSYPCDDPVDSSWVFHFKTTPENRIKLDIGIFDRFDYNYNCDVDYIELFDGASTESTSLGRFCGQKTYTPTITSSGNELYMVLNLDYYSPQKGFLAQYNTESQGMTRGLKDCVIETMDRKGYYCGRVGDKCICTITASSGNLTSINLKPDFTSTEVEWVYHIVTKPENRIKIVFDAFQLSSSEDYIWEHVELFDGSFSKGSGKFLGNDPPQPTVSATNELYVVFSSNIYHPHDGILAHYTTGLFDVEKPDGCVTNKWANSHDCSKGECHCDLSAPSGNITSPNYPATYPADKTWSWHIKTSPGYTIRLVFDDLKVKQKGNCEGDHIIIYDGGSTNSTALGRFCGLEVPIPIISSTNELYIIFKSDSNYGDELKGFLAHYTTGPFEKQLLDGCMTDKAVIGRVCAKGECSCDLSAPSGNITSPNYPRDLLANLDWDWHIKTTPGKRIKLVFDTLGLGWGDHTTITIYDGGSSNSSTLTRLGGTGVPYPIISSTNELYLELVSREYDSRGFSAHYTTGEYGILDEVGCTNSNDCGKEECKCEMTAPSGNITNPRNPSAYNNGEFAYHIKTTDKHRIKLNFDTVILPQSKSHNCDDDYVEFFDGGSKNASSLGRFCSGYNDKKPVIISSSDELYAVLRLNGYSPQKGFSAHYTTVPPFGAVLKAPELPSRCKGLHATAMPECSALLKDFIRFNAESHEIKKCMIGTLDIKDYSCARADDTCICKITASSGKINHVHDVFFGEQWQSWVYQIIATPGHRIKLVFDGYKPEPCTSCNYNTLKLYDGGLSDSKLLGKFQGDNLPYPMLTTTNELFIDFTTDPTARHKKFSAHFTAVLYDNDKPQGCITNQWDNTYDCSKGECQCDISAPSGNITSPNYPGTYPKDKEWAWNITLTPGQKIKLVFDHFDVGWRGGECESDYVKFYDGGSTNSTLLGHYCGSESPRPVISSTNQLYMVFKAESGSKGFSAQYTTGPFEKEKPLDGCTVDKYVYARDCSKGECHCEMADESGFITSPNFPRDYIPLLNWSWLFKTTPGNKIKLVFDKFELARPDPIPIYHKTGCYDDYVELYDGNSTSSKILGRFCGKKVPRPKISTSNQLYMIFKSDKYGGRRGFLAHYETVYPDHVIREEEYVEEERDLISEYLY